MSLRLGLLASFLVCGCNSDALVVGSDGAAPVDGSGGPGLDIAPEVGDLAMPDVAMPDLMAPRAWIRQFGTAADDGAGRVATDAAGNAYVTGWTKGGLGNQNAGGEDAFLVKYDASGNKLWRRQFGTAANDNGFGVSTDGAGNVYVTGSTSGGLDGNANAGDYDAFLVKYDGSGKKIWTRQLGTPFIDFGFGVATDAAGNVYVAGQTVGGLDGNHSAGAEDAYLVKYDANGKKIWTRQFGTVFADWALGVSTDGMGNVYVTGSTQGGLDGNQRVGYEDAFLVKYDANGNKLWTRQFGTDADDGAYDAATDGAGNVYVTGNTLGGLDGNQNAGQEDAFLVKYDIDGKKLWTRQFGTSGRDWPNELATDGAGHIYLAGETEGGLDGNQNAGSYDAFLVKYNTNGNRLWTRQLGTPADDRAQGVAIDVAGGVYVTGYTAGALAGNQNAGGEDAFLARFLAAL